MKISQVLRKSKRYLNDSVFVCVSVSNAFHHHSDIEFKDLLATKHYIERLIEPYITVDLWLKKKGVTDLTQNNLKIYRKRWVNHMINELEKEGK